MNVPNAAGKPEKQKGAQQDACKKAFPAPASVQEKGQASFFQNVNADMGFAMYGRQLFEIRYGNAGGEFLLFWETDIFQKETSGAAQV